MAWYRHLAHDHLPWWGINRHLYWAWGLAGLGCLTGWLGNNWWNNALPITYWAGGLDGTGMTYDQVIGPVDSTIQMGGPTVALNDADDWTPIGVFGLIPPGSDDIVASVQLAVNQSGIVRGYQTDLATDDVVDVYGGTARQNSFIGGQQEQGSILRISWQANADDSYKFDTTLDALVQSESVVNVFDPLDQSVSVWQVVRQDLGMRSNKRPSKAKWSRTTARALFPATLRDGESNATSKLCLNTSGIPILSNIRHGGFSGPHR